ncbi:hypothetical protein [Anaerostipes sp. PC18]|uniref:hypothetical protein n=1 Tax=Anaerostipes sp. PC18 TaxID=3036926 RepID=UPI00308D4E69|nr:hypothetical protein P8F77_17010 [Anaerostipes sp. PC18]
MMIVILSYHIKRQKTKYITVSAFCRILETVYYKTTKGRGQNIVRSLIAWDFSGKRVSK